MLRRLLLTVLVGLLAATPGAAGKKDKGKDKGKDKATAQTGVVLVFGAHEREVATLYFVESHGRGKCPPGLAKKNNGCLPPGQAKKRYAIGHPLPKELVLLPLPSSLEVRLGPPPSGYRYAMVDGDLVKLAVGTSLVVDAIQGLVN